MKAQPAAPNLSPNLRSRLLKVVGILLFTGTLTFTAQAGPLIYEGYSNYADGSEMLNQAVGANTIGLTGTYVTAVAGGTTVQAIKATSNGLSFSNLSVSGGAVTITDTNTWGLRGVAYNGTSVAAGSTIYTSSLFKLATVTVASIAEFRLAPTANSGGLSSYMGAFADAPNNLGAGVNRNGGGNGGATAEATSSQAITAGETYLTIGRFTKAGQNAMATNTVFLLTSNQFAAFVASGFADSYLDSAALGSGDGQIFDRVSFSAAGWGSAENLLNGTGIQVGLGATPGAVVDELRVGLSLADVLPVPEPTQVAMLAMGLAVLIARFRLKLRED